ncbi:MAG TPA: thioesterase domain-containing protein, partial [Longimicrobium sp.]|nr:thioesterase domain-containing protein [Longimicrobium sp.]
MPLLRADFALGETYLYADEPPLDVPISAYGGQRDDEVTLDEVDAWREQTTARFRMHPFPGDHFFVNGDRALVLAELSRELRPLIASLDDMRAHAF